MYFSVHEPKASETPVLVEVPHAGLGVDAEALASLTAPCRALGRDADLFVDELYADAPSVGAHLLVSRISRYVCDLNRGEDDVDSQAVKGAAPRTSPHGLIWRTTTDDRPALAAPLPRAELDRRLELIYRPYHHEIVRILTEKRRKFGFAILLCAHSMPSQGRAGHADPGRERADVVPGSRGRTSAAESVIDLAEDLAVQRHWTVAHDDPYKGGFSTGHYGRPSEGWHALQIELARRLYMDEAQLRRLPGDFEATRRYCLDLVAQLGRLDP